MENSFEKVCIHQYITRKIITLLMQLHLTFKKILISLCQKGFWNYKPIYSYLQGWFENCSMCGAE